MRRAAGPLGRRARSGRRPRRSLTRSQWIADSFVPPRSAKPKPSAIWTEPSIFSSKYTLPHVPGDAGVAPDAELADPACTRDRCPGCRGETAPSVSAEASTTLPPEKRSWTFRSWRPSRELRKLGEGHHSLRGVLDGAAEELTSGHVPPFRRRPPVRRPSRESRRSVPSPTIRTSAAASKSAASFDSRARPPSRAAPRRRGSPRTRRAAGWRPAPARRSGTGTSPTESRWRSLARPSDGRRPGRPTAAPARCRCRCARCRVRRSPGAVAVIERVHIDRRGLAEQLQRRMAHPVAVVHEPAAERQAKQRQAPRRPISRVTASNSGRARG